MWENDPLVRPSQYCARLARQRRLRCERMIEGYLRCYYNPAQIELLKSVLAAKAAATPGLEWCVG